MLKYEPFRYNIVVAAYPVFVCVVSRAGRQVDTVWMCGAFCNNLGVCMVGIVIVWVFW